MKTQKEISWSYPSSPNACKLGFARTGCWTVSLTNAIPQTDRAALPRAVSGHAKSTDAVNAADALPYEYSRWSVQNVRDAFGERHQLCAQSSETAATT